MLIDIIDPENWSKKKKRKKEHGDYLRESRGNLCFSEKDRRYDDKY